MTVKLIHDARKNRPRKSHCHVVLLLASGGGVVGEAGGGDVVATSSV